ncbi:MAG: BrnA antitoxin family protein, partial [Bdellovibrionaceae bacterium]|nr:BrnA antitoxin family protein [Pseudobdellovibrionaceae bacterium]
MTINNRKVICGKVEIPEEALDARNAKERITLMIDQDVLDEYRSKAQKTGDKYQSLITRTLRESL